MNRNKGDHFPAKYDVLGVGISATCYAEAGDAILAAARRCAGGTITALAVHGLVTGNRDPAFAGILNRFSMVTPDGQPVRKALKLLHGIELNDRVYGPTLMRELCRRAAGAGVGIYLYGSTAAVVRALAGNLQRQFPNLRVAGCEPSAFRPLTREEDVALVDRINSSGAGLLFVGLGCPLQERFAHEHCDSIRAVQVCVGAAFDFHAGTKRMAPAWMQRVGLEWFFRLASEPRRLWRRYFVTNSLFLVLIAREMLRRRAAPGASANSNTSGPRADWSRKSSTGVTGRVVS